MKNNIIHLLERIRASSDQDWFEKIVSFKENLEKESRSATTISSYLQDVLSALIFFQGQLPDDSASWRSLLRHRHQEGIKPQTNKKFIASLKSFSKSLDNPQMHSVIVKLPTPKTPIRHPKTIDICEVKKALQYTKENALVDARNQAILHLLYGCGLRISECLSLKKEDVQHGHVQVLGKGNKIRQIPLLPLIRDKIDHYVSQRPASAHPQLFLNSKNEPLSRHSFAQIVKNIRAQQGLPAHTTAHSFRHSFVSHLIENQASLKAIQNLVGHSSLATIQNYAHVSINHLQKMHTMGAKTWQKAVETKTEDEETN